MDTRVGINEIPNFIPEEKSEGSQRVIKHAA
jgi:hypothetical protein